MAGQVQGQLVTAVDAQAQLIMPQVGGSSGSVNKENRELIRTGMRRYLVKECAVSNAQLRHDLSSA
jgi:hypothetical protein